MGIFRQAENEPALRITLLLNLSEKEKVFNGLTTIMMIVSSKANFINKKLGSNCDWVATLHFDLFLFIFV